MYQWPKASGWKKPRGRKREKAQNGKKRENERKLVRLGSRGKKKSVLAEKPGEKMRAKGGKQTFLSPPPNLIHALPEVKDEEYESENEHPDECVAGTVFTVARCHGAEGG